MTKTDISLLSNDKIFEKAGILKKDIDNSELTAEQIIENVIQINQGMSSVRLEKPCVINDGIKKIEEKEYPELIAFHSRASAAGRLLKFVPASGAASRMYRKLEILFHSNKNSSLDDLRIDADEGISEAAFAVRYFENIKKFAFYPELAESVKKSGHDLDRLINGKNLKAVIDYTLYKKGLNFKGLPKGLVPFHQYENEKRTAFEEHLVEAVSYTADITGKSKLHFTISPDHLNILEDFFSSILPEYQKKGLAFDISFSDQKKSTDTLSLLDDGSVLRDSYGDIVYRPAGHGALLENLNELNGDIVFIKNVDNVIQDRYKDTTIKYKKMLCGYLLKIQQATFSFLNQLENDDNPGALINRIEEFAKKTYCLIPAKEYSGYSPEEKNKYWTRQLNRPLRVCGMVKNEGHPGGGPFWVRNNRGELTKQIIEGSQVDFGNESQKKIFNSSTHFNPVDLVCGIRDYKGEKFDLLKFRDESAGFVSKKSFNGKQINALELPGLWNGSMSDWLTVFIEAPQITFTPVKEINDLLNEVHQPLN